MSSEQKNQASLTTLKEIRAQMLRLWNRGDLLRAVLEQRLSTRSDDHSSTVHSITLPSSTAHSTRLAGGATKSSAITFPYKLVLKKPKSSDYGRRFDEVRGWVKTLSDIRYTRVELVETRHPQLGKNRVPDSLWVDSLQDAIALIGKGRDVEAFDQIVQRIWNQPIELRQALISWVIHSPLKSLELAEDWEQLLLVHSTIVKHPNSALYLRQVSVPGVDTKFIEAHRPVLGQWLDTTMPATSVHDQHTGARGFAKRFGFRDKPVRIRLRSMDSTKPVLLLPGQAEANNNRIVNAADITLDEATLCLLNPQHSHVIITENEINYLSLPELSNAIALFGSGYGLRILGGVEWLRQREVFYWGDIDTHGFAILDELRANLPEVKSLLMDSDTLLAHESFWTNESKPANRVLPRLSESETTLYRALVENRFGAGVRLEQERIDYQFVVSRLQAVGLGVVA